MYILLYTLTKICVGVLLLFQTCCWLMRPLQYRQAVRCFCRGILEEYHCSTAIFAVQPSVCHFVNLVIICRHSI